jgi:hypothetical protein
VCVFVVVNLSSYSFTAGSDGGSCLCSSCLFRFEQGWNENKHKKQIPKRED